MSRQLGAKALICAGLAAAAVFLLREDSYTFFIWWCFLLVIGAAFMPVTGWLFEGFEDKGWMFSKVVGVAVIGYVVWFLVTIGMLEFTPVVCIVVFLLCEVGNLVLDRLHFKKNRQIYPAGQWNLVFWEEVLFFVVFLIWTYMAGFRPEAYGTEKFMDYGFMEAMMRSKTLPATDMWYSEGWMNYYYGGQYYATFLTKLTGTHVEQTYNLMRTMVAAFAYVLPFSLVYQLYRDHLGKGACKGKLKSTMAGLLAGACVSLAGNMHYVVYRIVKPFIQRIQGIEPQGYWFPDATRYIGHYPEENLDRTIHEFPSYSFLLGDLHAHVVNLFFVLTVIGVLYAWIQRRRKKDTWIRECLHPHLILCGVFLGIFQWTNFWDFVIYYVVVCGVVFFGNLRSYLPKDLQETAGEVKVGVKKWLLVSVLHWVEILGIGWLVGLPFNLRFESMVSEVALVSNRSPFHQWCVLWALPVLVVAVFYLVQIVDGRQYGWKRFFTNIKREDLFVMILGICAIGLVVIPELVYVRDIYEETSARSNTMFKLTYQAFVMFGISMGYILPRFLETKKVWIRSAGLAGTLCVALTLGYIGNGTANWFGNIFDREEYRNLDATSFLETSFPEDAEAIRWLKENIEGSPVVLEANGDSYSDFERVSAMTGLPTVLGWYVHEWLWRQDTDDLNEKAADIETIYTSQDEQQVQELLEQYHISYIFIGSTEKQKYENLNIEGLTKMCEIQYQFEYDTMVLKMKQ